MPLQSGKREYVCAESPAIKWSKCSLLSSKYVGRDYPHGKQSSLLIRKGREAKHILDSATNLLFCGLFLSLPVLGQRSKTLQLISRLLGNMINNLD